MVVLWLSAILPGVSGRLQSGLLRTTPLAMATAAISSTTKQVPLRETEPEPESDTEITT